MDWLDLDLIADGINSFWARYGAAVILGVGLVGVLLCAYGIRKIVRAKQRARVISGVTAVIVLAWTSEGLWEVAYIKLALPIGFAIMTFFVFEAMMISSAVRAEEHRKEYGTPGTHGAYVWVLAAATATVVTLNASSLVEAVLRFSLPLLAAGLWWVDIVAPRKSDTAEVKARRAEIEKQRKATWAVTPRDLLVWAKLMRPGEQTTTQAERERRIRRMVVAADRIYSDPGSWTSRRAERRLRRLARSADAGDVTQVKERAARTAGIVALVVPARVDNEGTSEVDTGWTSGAAVEWTPVDTSGGHGQDSGVDKTSSRARVGGRTSRRGHAAAVSDDGLTKRQRRVLDLLAQDDPRLTQADIAHKLGVDAKTVQRELRVIRKAMGAKSTDQLRDITTGQASPVGVDSGVDMPPAAGVDTPAAASGHSPNGHADIDPGAVADMAATGDRT